MKLFCLQLSRALRRALMFQLTFDRFSETQDHQPHTSAAEQLAEPLSREATLCMRVIVTSTVMARR